MKKRYFFSSLLISFFTVHSVWAQWQKQNNTYGTYSSIAGNSQIILAAASYRLLVSEDAGVSWSSRTDFQYSSNFVLRKGNTFFAQAGSDFLVSSDGKNWEKKNGYGNPMAADENTLLGVASNKVYKSSDNGTNWQLLNLTLSISTDINSVAVAGNSMYIATWDGLYLSSDSGHTWKLVPNFYSEALSVSAAGTDVLVATRYSGIFYSTDSGQTWTNIRGDNYSHPVIKDSQFSVASITGNKFIVGSLYTGKVYLSEDKGKTWQDISAGLPTNAGIGAIAVIDDKLYLGTNNSTEGAIWQRKIAELADDFLLAPTSLTANTYLRDQTILKWLDHGTNEAGFKIERSIADTSHFIEIGSVPKDTTSFRDKDVVNGQTYYYRVKAYNSTKSSAYSNQLEIRRLPTTCGGYTKASSSPLYDVCFVSPSKGFAVGEFGKLLKTEDGGETWQDVRHCTSGTYTNIQFSSALVGYASGAWGSIMKTTDGGENWQALPAPTSSYASGRLFFLNDTVGFLAKEGVYKTTDGGHTWTTLYNSWDDFSDVFFINDMTGFISGRFNTLLKTTDGGKTWTAIDLAFLGFNKAVRRVSFIDANIGFIGGDGFIAKTTDSGKTWKRVEPSNAYPYVNDIYFLDSSTGYVTSGFNGGGIYKTTDAGETWESVSLSGTPFSIHFNGNTGCMVGEIDAGSATSFGRLLSITKDGGKSWKAISNAEYDSYSDGSFVTEKVGYLAHWPSSYTNNNNYFKTVDGGENWLEHSTNIEGDYPFIKFFNEQKGVMIGEAVLRTEDGGKTWTKFPHEMGYYNQIRGIEFVSENTWFIGTYSDGFIYRTTDGGKSLVKISQIPGPLISMDFASAQIGFVGTLFGKIYRTTDGGITWKVVYDDYNGENYTGIFSIHFVNNQIGYAAGTKGAILKTEDGGSTWQYLQGEFVGFSQRQYVDFRKITFFDEHTGYIASYNPGLSNLYKTTDGGKTWFGVNTFDNGSFWFIHFFDRNNVLIAGGEGLIVKLENETTPCKPNFFTGEIKEVCLNKQYNYSVANYNNMSYEWSVSGGEITHSDRNTIVVQWNQVGKQQLSVNSADDCGTSGVITFEVQVNDLPEKPTIARQNDSTLISSSSTGNQWLLDGQLIAGANKQVLTYTKTGTYSVQVSTACGRALSDTINVDLILSVEETLGEKIQVFPNPADSYVRVESDRIKAIDSIEIMDIRGKHVYSTSIASSAYTIPTNSLSSGIYFIKIHTGSEIVIRKIVIR
jgi:photosystem II stability/assembly factor-like uncharacterized protein